MAAIFPPSDQGGVAPGPNVCNGYVPENPVNGGGPYYIAADCTTVLTDCQLNAITSEILAAVDRLGYGYNSTRITNLGDALVDRFSFKVDRAGDTMLGPLMLFRDPVEPMEAVTKQYCDDADQSLELNKVSRAGDTMTGPLTLSGNPTAPLHAAPRQYVDAVDARVDGKVSKAGDTMTGPLVLAADPTAPLQPVTLKYAQANFVPEAPLDGILYGRANGQWIEAGGAGGGFLLLSGGTMTGPLILAADPTSPLGAVTRQYVENNAVRKAGDTMSGALILANGTEAIGEAPTDGLTYARANASWVHTMGAVSVANGLADGNLIVNGSMAISQQRGTAAAAWSDSLVDQWGGVVNGATSLNSAQNTVDVPPGYTHSLRTQVTLALASPAATDMAYIWQNMEWVRVARLSWYFASALPATLGFWVKSSVTGIYSGAVKPQGVDMAYPFEFSVNTANTWEFKTVTIPPPTVGAFANWMNGLVVVFALMAGSGRRGSPNAWSSGGTVFASNNQINFCANLNATFLITGVVLLPGVELPPLDAMPSMMRDIPRELALCQRYFNRIEASNYIGNPGAGNFWNVHTWYPPMRIAPAVSLFGVLYGVNASNLVIGAANINSTQFAWFATASGLSQASFGAFLNARI